PRRSCPVLPRASSRQSRCFVGPRRASKSLARCCSILPCARNRQSRSCCFLPRAHCFHALLCCCLRRATRVLTPLSYCPRRVRRSPRLACSGLLHASSCRQLLITDLRRANSDRWRSSHYLPRARCRPPRGCFHPRRELAALALAR